MEFVLFSIFLISVFFLGSLVVGPVSIRVWMTVLTLGLLIIHIEKLFRIKLSNNLIVLYCCYLVCMSMAMYFNGEFSEYGVIKFLLAFHLVCIVSYYAVRYYINDIKSLNTAGGILIVAVILNSIVTILQFMGNYIGWGINLALTDFRNEMVVENSETVSDLETMLGLAKTPGLLDSAVANGMFISSLGILPFIYLYKSRGQRNILLKIICWCSIALSAIACYMCQERAALLMFAASLIYLLWNWTKNKKIMVLAIIGDAFYFGTYFVNDASMLGRFADFSVDDDLRSNIWDAAKNFIAENLMWGGPLHFLQKAGHFPHNFFLNALIYGGVIGGIFIIVVFLKIVYRVVRAIRKGSSSEEIVYATALLSYLMQGMFHNASLVTGSVTIFVLLGLMESSKAISKNNVK